MSRVFLFSFWAGKSSFKDLTSLSMCRLWQHNREGLGFQPVYLQWMTQPVHPSVRHPGICHSEVPLINMSPNPLPMQYCFLNTIIGHLKWPTLYSSRTGWDESTHPPFSRHAGSRAQSKGNMTHFTNMRHSPETSTDRVTVKEPPMNAFLCWFFFLI